MLHKKVENCFMREYSERKLDYIRSSRPEVFCKKGVLRNFPKFTGNHLCQSLRSTTLFKKRLWHRYSPKNFAV